MFWCSTESNPQIQRRPFIKIATLHYTYYNWLCMRTILRKITFRLINLYVLISLFMDLFPHHLNTILHGNYTK